MFDGAAAVASIHYFVGGLRWRRRRRRRWCAQIEQVRIGQAYAVA